MFGCLEKCFKSKQKVIPEKKEVKKKESKLMKEKEVDSSSTFMCLKDNIKISSIIHNMDFDKYSQKDVNMEQPSDKKARINNNLPEDTPINKGSEVLNNTHPIEYKSKFGYNLF